MITIPGHRDRRSGRIDSLNLVTESVREALIVAWEASDRICGKRLKAVLPSFVDAMERHGHLDLDPYVRERPALCQLRRVRRAHH